MTYLNILGNPQPGQRRLWLCQHKDREKPDPVAPYSKISTLYGFDTLDAIPPYMEIRISLNFRADDNFATILHAWLSGPYGSDYVRIDILTYGQAPLVIHYGWWNLPIALTSRLPHPDFPHTLYRWGAYPTRRGYLGEYQPRRQAAGGSFSGGTHVSTTL